jgi:peptidoglycan/LPS O-acetylase OafA/YrhL
METHVRGRIPSLDGLRALSISAVLLGHMAGTVASPAWLNAIIRNPYLDIAHFGVRVFFVISGYLITGLLMAEKERTGTISLKEFYFRRTLRIFPAYLALLAVLALLALTGVISLTGSDFVHAVTYTMNYSPDRSWDVGHLWSLAVEEQFYLLWPATVLALGLEKGGRVALAVVLVAPIIRVGEATFFPQLMPLIGTSFETTADALAMGCLLALWHQSLEANRIYRWALRFWPAIPFLILASVLAGLRYRPGLLVGDSLANLAVALLISRSVSISSDRWGRLLNGPLLIFVGTLSYSLYLWQQPFLNRNLRSFPTSFPLNLALASACALLSYYLVEQPALRLRARLSRRSANRRAATLPELIASEDSVTR